MDAAGVYPACASSALAYYAMHGASKRPCREQQVKAESRLRLHLQCSGCWHSTYPHLAVSSFSTWWRGGDANLRWLQSLTQPDREVWKQSSRGDSSHPVRCKLLPSKRLPRKTSQTASTRLPRDFHVAAKEDFKKLRTERVFLHHNAVTTSSKPGPVFLKNVYNTSTRRNLL